MTRPIKDDRRNIGKAVTYTFKRGANVYTSPATILSFRGGRHNLSVWIRLTLQSGLFRVVCVHPDQLEYVKVDDDEARRQKNLDSYYPQPDCDCMTEPDEHGEERVLIHSLRCSFHPDYEETPA